MGDGNDSISKKKSKLISPPAGTLNITGNDTESWISQNFSPYWFDAALKEISSSDQNSICREILFSSCFLESYIFEWARDIDIKAVNDYFPAETRCSDGPRYRRTLVEKWKQVPGALFRDRRIKAQPQLDLSQLGTLVKYRNGLVHASASRPSTASQPPSEKPVPSAEELTRKKAGWALSIAVSLVKKLHCDLATTPPVYLKRYINKTA